MSDQSEERIFGQPDPLLLASAQLIDSLVRSAARPEVSHKRAWAYLAWLGARHLSEAQPQLGAPLIGGAIALASRYDPQAESGVLAHASRVAEKYATGGDEGHLNHGRSALEFLIQVVMARRFVEAIALNGKPVAVGEPFFKETEIARKTVEAFLEVADSCEAWVTKQLDGKGDVRNFLVEAADYFDSMMNLTALYGVLANREGVEARLADPGTLTLADREQLPDWMFRLLQ